jgi:ribosomal protein L13E
LSEEEKSNDDDVLPSTETWRDVLLDKPISLSQIKSGSYSPDKIICSIKENLRVQIRYKKHIKIRRAKGYSLSEIRAAGIEDYHIVMKRRIFVDKRRKTVYKNNINLLRHLKLIIIKD